jgi:hypothetical protein
VVSEITSLGPDRADPACWLHGVRGHWQLEHKVQGMRDVTFDEDRSPVRGGSLPRGMAAFRHTTIGLRHWVGATQIAAACRRCAAQPWLV